MARFLAKRFHLITSTLPRSNPTNTLQKAFLSSTSLEWLSKFTNYEQKGVPDAAGTDTDRGFDLVRHSFCTQCAPPPIGDATYPNNIL